ncbi:MAG: hypothetical protein M1541_01635 [Acidobacteria bacterium]|nr:hypothetical protein [Acidobacteriota bacterium]
MSDVDELLTAALKQLPPKPPDTANREKKQKYSQDLSAVVAVAFAEAFRNRNLRETAPVASVSDDILHAPKTRARKGAERRMAGGLGAKKVDVTWATDEGGLILALSIKSVNFRDQKTGNYQKNLTNRRGDMLFESTTLHRRFPYAVLGGFVFLDKGAASDGTQKRKATALNAHSRFRIFTGRNDPAGRPEQYERLYIILVDASPDQVQYEVHRVGDPKNPIPLETAFNELLELVAERNPDFYEVVDGKLEKAG